MVVLVQCAKSSHQKWLKFSQNAYLPNTKGFSKHGFGLVLGLKIFFGGGVGQAHSRSERAADGQWAAVHLFGSEVSCSSAVLEYMVHCSRAVVG